MSQPLSFEKRMNEEPKHVSKIYEMVGWARRIGRPAPGGIKRKLSMEEKRARGERENQQTLKRVQRYLKAAQLERSEVDELIADGRAQDRQGRRLDYRRKNLANRETRLRAAIAKLTGKQDTGGVQISGIKANSDIAEAAVSRLPSDPAAPPLEELGCLGVPLPTEKQRLEGLTYSSRDGQDVFRSQVLAAYGGCALTGCQDFAVLEAAHIIPYVNAKSNVLHNGICLRADIHLLFDRGLIHFDDEYKTLVSAELTSPEYRELHSRRLKLPMDTTLWPDKRFLAMRCMYLK